MKYQTGQRDGLLMDSAKDLIVIEEEASPFDHFIRPCDRCGGRFPSSYEKVVLSLSATKKKKKKKRERWRETETERERDGREWQTWNMESTLCSSSSFLRITLSQRLAQEKDRDAEKETS